MPARIVLVKHAQPVLDARVPPREWQLAAEGEAQSRHLAQRLRAFVPFRLVSSAEAKARRTAEIVAGELGIAVDVVDGLEEFDRPAHPIVSREEHERLNARIFDERSSPVLGRESAVIALARFSAAVTRARADTPDSHDLVVVSHGTVIALFVEQVTGRDARETWRTLQCAEFTSVSG